jgi:hypothetical protein
MTRRQHRGEIRTPDGLRPGSTGISMVPQTVRSTDHPGSKPWFIHLTQPTRRSRTATPAAGQKSVPPHVRTDRPPLAPVQPMGEQDRWDRYTLGGTHRTLTGPQRRRFTHKHGWRMLDVYLGHTAAQLPSSVMPDEPHGLL